MTTFLDNEINATKSIQDRSYAKKLYKGLTTICINFTTGKVFFYDTDEEEFCMFDYVGKDFVYHIGRDFVTKPIDSLMSKHKYLLVTMDANECTIGELNGKSIKVLWQKQSFVPRKQGSGGQSQVRFMENRRLALLKWEKEIAEVLKKIYYGGVVK
jgi:hypothetical protein